MKKITREDLLTSVTVAGAILFLICIYAPLELYFNNSQEFWFDIYTLFPITLLMFFSSFFVCIFIFFIFILINKKIYQFGIVFGFILFLCTYVQGNFLVNNLPPLDGTAFTWAEYSDGRSKSVCLWIIVTLVTLIALRVLHFQRFSQGVKVISICMVLMLSITLFANFITTKGYREKLDASVTVKNQFEMSEDTNFIILLLDAVTAETFYDIVENTPEYKDVFSDFTFYPNTVGAYTFTSRSIPFIFSGEWFENMEPFEQYNERIYKDSAFFSNLESKKYKLGMYESVLPLSDKSIYRFENVLENDVKITSYFDFIKLELKLIGFKYAPFDLKTFCVFNTNDFFEFREIEDKYTLFSADNGDFYSRIKDESITYTKEKCFKFIHIEGAHVPFNYDKDVNIIEEGTYEQKIEASITITDTYLKKLKENGVYNNSIIVVLADHGYDYTGLGGRQNPLLMIKGINEEHTWNVSNAPISFEDLQVAYKNLLSGKQSTEVFEWKEGDERERRFLWYKYVDESHIVEYIWTGEAWDTTAKYCTGREFNQ